jgi:hypothetical protein
VKQITSKRRGLDYDDATHLREASVSSFESPEKHGNRQRILAILVVQIAVLLGVCWGAIVYINWASAAAQAEFMNALPPASVRGDFSPSSAPTKVAKVKAPCVRKG